MPAASNEEQFKFLISCIRYSNNGKVDFGEVANECNIVSKGAAAKRYERMMKAHGIAANAASVRGSSSVRSVKAERSDISSPAAKKRKTDSFANDHGTEDDQEQFDVKPDPVNDVELLHVKEEPETGHMHINNNQDLGPFMADPNTPASQSMEGNSYISGANHFMQTRESHGSMYGMQATESAPGYMPFYSNINTDSSGNSTGQLDSSKEETILID